MIVGYFHELTSRLVLFGNCRSSSAYASGFGLFRTSKDGPLSTVDITLRFSFELYHFLML